MEEQGKSLVDSGADSLYCKTDSCRCSSDHLVWSDLPMGGEQVERARFLPGKPATLVDIGCT